MKQKSFMRILFLFFFTPVISAQSLENKIKQDELVKKYFTLTPEEKPIDEFISLIKNNMTLFEDTLISRTDTSLLYFRAFSNTYNPFSFPVSKIEIQIREGVLSTSSEKIPVDTFLTIQIIAITDSNNKTLDFTKKEFKVLHKQIVKIYSSSKYFQVSNKKALPYESQLYYNTFLQIFPALRLSYGRYYADKSASVLSLEVNYKMLFD